MKPEGLRHSRIFTFLNVLYAGWTQQLLFTKEIKVEEKLKVEIKDEKSSVPSKRVKIKTEN